MKNFLFGLILAAIVFCIAFPVGYRRGVKSVSIETPPPDTVTITKTVRDTEYVPKPYPVYSKIKDTVWLTAKADTIEIEVPVPIEQKLYEHEDFKAWVSGYRPVLDSIWIYPETQYIQTTVTETRIIKEETSPWALSINAGYGITPAGLQPNINIGVSYRIWSPKKRKSVLTPP